MEENSEEIEKVASRPSTCLCTIKTGIEEKHLPRIIMLSGDNVSKQPLQRQNRLSNRLESLRIKESDEGH